ncbi:urea ABC transporter permease subunit UrtC [Planctomycetota bacterium]|nr:urea ABC transporter permease subunit UrtC [Planctomycetota bacterium]
MTDRVYPNDLREFALAKAIRAGGWQAPVLWFDQAGLALLAFVLLFVMPMLHLAGLADMSLISQIGRYCALALVAIGLDLVWGYTGILSLCQAMFFTVGGYALGMFMCMHGPMDPKSGTIPMQLFVVTSDPNLVLPWFWQPFAWPWFAVAMVLLLPAIAAWLIGFFAFRSRIKGVYFSIITQAITIAAWLMFCRNDLMLCGTNGLSGIQILFGGDMRDPGMKMGLYLVSVLTMLGATLFALALVQTRFGRILVAIRDSESRVRFTGLSPVRYKTAIFVIAAILAGIGGALYAPQTQNINPSNMAASASILVVVWVAVGGRGTIIGPVVGTLAVCLFESFLTSGRTITLPFAPEWLNAVLKQFMSKMPQFWMLIIGMIFILVVLFLPDGLIGRWRALVAYVRGTSP